MNRTRLPLTLALVLLVCSAGIGLSAAPRVGQPAPAFAVSDDHGTTRRLAEFAGKSLVLEWHNNGCPYVRKHYDSGRMQGLQEKWTGKGVAWLTVISSAPGTQGYVTADQSKAFAQKSGMRSTAILLDPRGELGHLYDARNTPQMFVIDPQGVLIYSGAIDDRPSPDASSLTGAKNFVDAALTEAMAGRPVSTATSVPYGCTVKYR